MFSKKLISFVIFQLWEVAVFAIAVFVGFVALENEGLLSVPDYGDVVGYTALISLGLLWNRLLNGFDLYLSRRLIHRSNEYYSLVLAVVVAAGFLSILGALIGQPTNQATFLVWFMVTALVLLLPGRFVSRLLLRAARAYGRNVRFVAIVGAGREGQALAHHIEANPQSGFDIVGLFDDETNLNNLPKDMPRGGSLEDLRQQLMREPVDEVLIALPMATHFNDIAKVLSMCARTGVSARVTGGLVDTDDLVVPQVERIGNQACLHYCAEPNWGWQAYAKRLFDIVGATVGLLLLSPLLVPVMVMIKLDSPGPIFFVQNRVGRHRKPFRFYKFRTMVPNAEALQQSLESQNEAGGPVFKIRKDPRITRLGAFLRRYSIDELPQLMNVLKGDMSLVGPRPLPFRDVERFEHDWHSRRFSVRPGLTCAWVLHGRSQLEFDAWVRTDLDYIDNWSLMGDIMICLRTIPAVVRGSGAY